MNRGIRYYLLCGAVGVALTASTFSFNALADSAFSDVGGHWAENEINKWSEKEIIVGNEGRFEPDAEITRAETATIINRIMNYQTASENVFLDLTDDWYKEAVLKAAADNVIIGYEGYARPNDPVTREEAFVMLARALRIDPSDGDTDFTDDADISDWAKGYVYSMYQKGYISGFEDGSFRPDAHMTKAYAVKLIDNIIKGFYNKPGTYSETADGLVVINTSGVTLNNMQIKELLLTQGVGDGKVTLTGTTSVESTPIILAGSVDNEGSGDVGEENPGDNNDNNNNNNNNGSGGSGGGGWGSSGGGTAVVVASKNSIIVNGDYAGREGNVVVNRRRYTYGTNAFGTIQEAVNKVEELGQKSTITLTADMTIENTVVVNVPEIVFDGGNHTVTVTASRDFKKDGFQFVEGEDVEIKNLRISMSEAENGWKGSYAIQLYETAAKLSDITVSGADAGVLVNGADVSVNGSLDVSGNEFGGIELSRGAEATNNPAIKGAASDIVNTTEEAGKPTIWVDSSDTTPASMDITGLFEKELVAANGKLQRHFYLSEDNLPQDESVAVTDNYEDIKNAVANEEVQLIKLSGDIETTEALNITRDVSIDGQGNTLTVDASNKNAIVINAADTTRADGEISISNINITFTGEAPVDWRGAYGINLYRAANVKLRDISVSNGNAGVLINGSSVTLEGVVDVSNNTFGGIEVSKGVDVTEAPYISGDVSNLKNDSEAVSKPTVWTDGEDVGADRVNVTGLTAVENAKTNQNHFFINPENASATVNDADSLKAALANNNIRNILLSEDISLSETLNINRNVVIDGQGRAVTAPLSVKKIIIINTEGADGYPQGAELRNINVAFSEAAPSDWQSAYAIQIYRSNDVTLNNVTAKNGNAGILVNGSVVTLGGNIDVSDNSFGGIEVSKGSGVETEPRLNAENCIISNTSEAEGKPTIWIDNADFSTVLVNNMTSHHYTGDGKNQMHYYLNDVNAPVTK